MAWIETIEEGAATGQLKDIYEGYVKRAGRGPNIIKIMSLRPEALNALEEFRRTIIFGGSSLGRRREELIRVVASALNRCTY